ncbi:MAG: sulfotransferase [Anaerolineae bacterium]|nr:sulfotransferase [Anaerolineae bacterium]
MNREEFAALFEHPVAMGSFRNWLRLLTRHKDLDSHYLLRILFVTLTTLLTSPVRLFEQLHYGNAVRRTQIPPAPIFIIGHWRTGTTHLHLLLSKDSQFGSIPMFQTLAPGFFLIGRGFMKKIVGYWLEKGHPTRFIDNIPLRIDAPQEEEFALANMTPICFLHIFSFPRQAAEIFAQTTLFQNISPEALNEWTACYLEILRKATLHTGGKQLLLKNCADTGRIRVLLELFPDARFIHMVRNPYDLFLSTRRLWKVVLSKSQLQTIEPAEVDRFILQFYPALMQQYLADSALIPPGRLVEVRFEDLEAAPLAEVRRIYQALNLPNFAAAEPAFQSYLASVSDYRKNQYHITADVIELVNREWSLAFDIWGYTRLDPTAAPQQY